MHRRLLALVLGLLVAGAPEALAACHFTCTTSRADDAIHGHHGHSSGHSPATATTIGPQTSAHVCGHADALPEAAGRAPQIGAPSGILTIASATLPLPPTAGVLGAPQEGPPLPILLATPLRV